MKTELTYALITPYTILKSRTGGVISRLLSRTDLEFCGAQIFAPSLDLAENYAKSMATQPQQGPAGILIQRLLSEYIQRTEDGAGFLNLPFVE